MSDNDILISSKIPGDLLGRAYAQLDAASESFDKNWLSLLIAAGLSIGLVFGLDRAISLFLVHDAAYGAVIALVMPFVSFYLFLRFGALSYNFSNAKFSAESLTSRYLRENGLDDLNPSNGRSLAKEELYATTSYFDSFYSPNLGAGLVDRIAIFIYGLLIPVVLAMNHATSLFLLWRFPEKAQKLLQLPAHRLISWVLCITYGVLVFACYAVLYAGLRKMAANLPLRWTGFIVYVDTVALLMTIVFLIGLNQAAPKENGATWTLRATPQPATIHLFCGPTAGTTVPTTIRLDTNETGRITWDGEPLSEDSKLEVRCPS